MNQIRSWMLFFTLAAGIAIPANGQLIKDGWLLGYKGNWDGIDLKVSSKVTIDTAEVVLVEPKSGYSRLATFTLTVGKDGKVSKKVSFGKIKAEE